MKVLTFEQFIAESSADHFATHSLVHQVLLKNRDRIKDEANIDDIVFNQIIDDMCDNPPKSLKDEDLVDDAIKMAYLLRQEYEPYMKMDQGDRMADEIGQFDTGKTGVAVQNFETNSEDDD